MFEAIYVTPFDTMPYAVGLIIAFIIIAVVATALLLVVVPRVMNRHVVSVSACIVVVAILLLVVVTVACGKIMACESDGVREEVASALNEVCGSSLASDDISISKLYGNSDSAGYELYSPTGMYQWHIDDDGRLVVYRMEEVL